MNKKLLVAITTIVLTASMSTSVGLLPTTAVQPEIINNMVESSTNTPIEVVANESKQEKMEATESDFSLKTVVLSSDKVISRGGTPPNYNHEEIMLLAKVIQSEALSEPYDGKVAVGSVVINRMKKYNKSMSYVVYEKNQFSGVGTRLFNTEPSQDCIQAAKDSMDGIKPFGEDVLYFVNLNVVKPNWIKRLIFIERIGNHWFYKDK